jgi:hypothetical protein
MGRTPALAQEQPRAARRRQQRDRLISFYERIFDARVTLEREDDGRRHAGV